MREETLGKKAKLSLWLILNNLYFKRALTSLLHKHTVLIPTFVHLLIQFSMGVLSSLHFPSIYTHSLIQFKPFLYLFLHLQKHLYVCTVHIYSNEYWNIYSNKCAKNIQFKFRKGKTQDLYCLAMLNTLYVLRCFRKKGQVVWWKNCMDTSLSCFNLSTSFTAIS